MVVKHRGALMKKFRISAAMIAAFAGAAFATHAWAADVGMPTKAPPPPPAPPAPVACGTIWDFFVTNCPLSWSGITIYGTVDMGVTYQTHGTPFDPNFPTGASYLLGAGGGNATNRSPGFGLAPNGLSQSNIGLKINEPVAPGGWSFIGQFELAYDPYSFLLSNAPQAMQNGIGVAENQQALPFDSSRWGWLAATNMVGFSQPVFGTLTFGRQNSLQNDSLNAFDPFGASYAFAMIGYSGKFAGGGATEEARWTTAIKYRVNVGDFRFAVEGQPFAGSHDGYDTYNPNNGAIAGEVGWDIKNYFPGVLSLNFIGAWERDAVNIGTTFPGQTFVGISGTPLTFPSGFSAGCATCSGLKATLSDNTSFTAEAKYSFGSWGTAPPPVVAKAPPPPAGPSGIPLTVYAGYEWIQFTEPSDQQLTSFRDDGFVFNFWNTAASSLSANGTTIANNAFNSLCKSHYACTNEIFQFVWTGFKYGFTRDLDLIGAYYHEWQDQFINPTDATGAAKTCQLNSTALAQCAGSMDEFSVALDWRFLPKWDAYIGTAYSVAYGGIANGDITRNNLATTGGVRFRF